MPLPAIISRIAQALSPTNPTDMSRVLLAAQQRSEWAQMYACLELYYGNNALYDSLAKGLYEQGQWHEAMKALRNPTYRVVEFYASKIWGPFDDELDLETPNDSLEPAIRQLWKWSTWAERKTLAGRQLAEYGDWFARIAQNTNRDRVFFQFIKPVTVTSFLKDERDNIVWIRLDVPIKNPEGTNGPIWHTEVWSKELQTLRIWQHSRSPETPLLQMGTPQTTPFEALAIDFVPFVHSKFKDVGEDRGQAAIMPAIDKIDEANRIATRLHQTAFKGSRITWALRANQVGQDGRPISAPRVQPDDPNAPVADQQGTVTIGDERMYRLPGNSDITSVIPDLPYADLLAILVDMMKEIQRDLPELAYYELRDMSQISGVAARLLLSDAIDRALEARGNQFNAVVRLTQMGISIGRAAGLPLFDGFSATAFDDGDLEFDIKGPDIIPLSTKEKAEARQLEAQAATTLHDLGVSQETLLTELGYDPQQEATQRESEQQANDANLLTAFERGAPQLGNGRPQLGSGRGAA